MIRLPTLRQLAHLVALAEHRHFGRAARAVHVTQPTLSASIKELEATLGADLVDRTRRRVVLTPAGEEAVTRARRILREAEELALAAGRGEPLSGALRLGVIPTIGPFLLPSVLPRLRERYPRLQLHLREDQTARLVADLEAGRLDVLLLALPCECTGAETMGLFEDPFLVALPADHPLSGERRVEAARLAGAPLLLLEDGHCLREHALAACGLRRATGEVGTLGVTSLHTLVQMVDNGLGITLLPRLALEAGVCAGTRVETRPLAGEGAARTVGLAWRAGSGRAEEFRLLGREIKALALAGSQAKRR